MFTETIVAKRTMVRRIQPAATRPDSNSSSSRPWEPWAPSKQEPWDQRRVAHLHRRAGFAATWPEIVRDLNGGHTDAIERFLSGSMLDVEACEEFESAAETISITAKENPGSGRLHAWWFKRMLYSSDPFTEKLTLMWHNHFATSNTKVRSSRQMFQQNQIFRKHGRGDFGELFSRVLQDPAILVYLDADSNRKSHPNENLGREMLELFSLGEGNYTEEDVRNAARCLTGWTVDRDTKHFVPEFHDGEEKVLLGKKGNFDGEDAIRIALEHPATAVRITKRVCNLFMGEGVVADTDFESLAVQFRKNNLNINWLVETILKSNLFFSDANIGNRILSGVEFCVGYVRATGALSPSPNTEVLAEWASRMGHRLLHPPTVFGFPEGRAWITSQWLIARKQFVTKLLDGKLHGQQFEFLDSLKRMVGQSENVRDPRFLAALVLMNADQSVVDQFEQVQQNEKADPKAMMLQILSSSLANLG